MLRPEKDILASSHEIPLLKGASRELFHTDRVDLRDKFDPKLPGGGAQSDHRLICDRLHTLRLSRLQRPWSEIIQTRLMKILCYLLFILLFLRKYLYFCCLRIVVCYKLCHFQSDI